MNRQCFSSGGFFCCCLIISSVQVRECAAKKRTLWAYPHDLLERGQVAPAPAGMPAAMRLLPSSHLSSLMVGVPFTFPPPTPLLRSTTFLQKMLASRLRLRHVPLLLSATSLTPSLNLFSTERSTVCRPQMYLMNDLDLLLLVLLQICHHLQRHHSTI